MRWKLSTARLSRISETCTAKLAPIWEMRWLYSERFTGIVLSAWFVPSLLLLLFIYVVAITLINVVAVGYDPIAYNSMDFNGTHGLWYDKFIPNRGPDYSHRECEQVILKLNDFFVTNSTFRFFLYELVDFIDPSISTPINGVNYSNNAFYDCAISTLEMAEYLQPVPPELKATAIINCNSTSSNYLYFRTAADQGLNSLASTDPSAVGNLAASLQGPLDISDTVQIWSLITRTLWYNLSPFESDVAPLFDTPSLLRLALVGATPLSYLKFGFADTLPSTSPDIGSWVLQVTYLNQTGSSYVPLRLTFLQNGTLDTTVTPSSNLTDAERVLAPVITEMTSFATAAQVPNFNFWQFMNWIFVSQYWAVLLDFGQITPANFRLDNQGNPVTTYPMVGNIFTNDTLFNAYEAYLRSTILPLLRYTLTDFAPLSPDNQLVQNNATLEVLYFCTDKTLKDSSGLVISLIVADWALITAVWTLARISRKLWLLRRVEDIEQHAAARQTLTEGFRKAEEAATEVADGISI